MTADAMDERPPTALVGIIGGSGLYTLPALTDVESHAVSTPFGDPSGPVVTGTIHDAPVAFIPRHGPDHALLPSEIPYRANVYALKALGVRYVLSVSAVGSLAEDMAPLDVVLPDQFIDATKHRVGTFFGDGAVAHVSMAQPTCAALRRVIEGAAHDATSGTSRTVHTGGTYLCMEGPQFSSLAESNLYRQWGAHIIGMTNMPEAKLAREAEMAYATIAMVTDYDCWHPHEDDVSTDLALQNLRQNAELSQQLVATVAATLAKELPTSDAHTALDAALVTQPAHMPDAVKARLAAVISRLT